MNNIKREERLNTVGFGDLLALSIGCLCEVDAAVVFHVRVTRYERDTESNFFLSFLVEVLLCLNNLRAQSSTVVCAEDTQVQRGPFRQFWLLLDRYPQSHPASFFLLFSSFCQKTEIKTRRNKCFNSSPWILQEEEERNADKNLCNPPLNLRRKKKLRATSNT